MHCRDVRGLADSYVDGELSTDESRELVQHLAGCPACRDDVDTRRALKAGVQRGFRAATELTPTSRTSRACAPGSSPSTHRRGGARGQRRAYGHSPQRSSSRPRRASSRCTVARSSSSRAPPLVTIGTARSSSSWPRRRFRSRRLRAAMAPPIACSRPSRQRRCRRRRARPASSPGIRACTWDGASHTWSSSIAACTCRCS